MKFDWNDIVIVHEVLSEISSRSEINPYYSNGKLPVFTAPMDMVIDENIAYYFYDNRLNICLPRNVKYSNFKNNNYFYSYGLDEIIILLNNNEELPNKILIDVANGCMQRLYDTSKRIKENYNVELMIGNIANPDTFEKYCEIGVDYIRCSVGTGAACTTAINTAINYPLASLITECSVIAKRYDNKTKIIADGGFKNYSDIIKALGLGAHYVMLGSLLSKSIESCSKSYLKGYHGYYQINDETALRMLNNGTDVFKYYRGMSTKEVQKAWNKKELKTSEGIAFYNKIEYQLHKWIENLTDYMKSNMSYTNSKDLESYIGEVRYELITNNAFLRFNK